MMTDIYKKNFEKGLKFQDHVTELLIKELGIALSTYQSRDWQLKGENKQGIEIKFDDRYSDTGNLYIEISEKSNKNNNNYVPSGIYRKDNTWLYIIGNYDELYIFGKKILIEFYESGFYLREVETPTSRGFLIEKESAQKYALKVI